MPTPEVAATGPTVLPPEVPRHPVALTAAEITGLIGLFQTMLDKTERTILERLDENTNGATRRWERHERESAERWSEHLADHAKLEADLASTSASVLAHHQAAHDAMVAAEARVKPVKTLAGWIFDHWERIVLVFVAILAFLAASGEWVGRVLGPHAP